MKGIVKYFDKLEDRIRGRLSRYPILYTFIGGSAIVLFWRGVWHTVDQIALQLPPELVWIDGPLSIIVSCFILLITGLFVSFFVNDKIILSGIKQEKKLVEKTEIEIHKESTLLKDMDEHVVKIEGEVKELYDHLMRP